MAKHPAIIPAAASIVDQMEMLAAFPTESQSFVWLGSDRLTEEVVYLRETIHIAKANSRAYAATAQLDQAYEATGHLTFRPKIGQSQRITWRFCSYSCSRESVRATTRIRNLS